MHRPDTSEEVQAIYDERVRRMTEEERFFRGLSLTHLSRSMTLSGIKERSSVFSPREIKIMFLETLYGHLFSPEEKEAICRVMLERAGS